MSLEKRVVITGMGVVSPLGVGYEKFIGARLNGETSIRNITDTHKWLEGFNVQIGSFFEKSPVDEKAMRLKGIRKRSAPIFAKYALQAAIEAVDHSGLDLTNEELQYRTGVHIGTGSGPLIELEQLRDKVIGDGMDSLDMFTVPRIISDAAAGLIASQWGLHATAAGTAVGACAAGSMSLVDAYNAIRLGDADVMITGGAESVCAGDKQVASLAFGGFDKGGALTTDYNSNPEKASRPFDKDRTGFVLGEGAAVYVIEDLEYARSRGATILAEIVGYGATCDADPKIMQPQEEAKYTTHAMKLALQRGNLSRENVALIVAHGTSTAAGDPLEVLAVKQTLGDHANNVYVTAPKSSHAHSLGASSALAMVEAVHSIKYGVVAPTLNLENLDEACAGVNHAKETVETDVPAAIVNAFGFYGHNVAIALKKYQD